MIESQKAVRRPVRSPPKQRSTLPSLLLAGAFIGFLWWRTRTKSRGGDSGKKLLPKKAQDTSRSSLPRNKGNNKNKQRHKDQRKEKNEKRASKREEQQEKPKQPDRSDPNDPNNRLIFNYSYFDSARRDHLVPAPKRVPGPPGSTEG
eukprot:jgi/Botrbrau1/2010/Bobra.0052s0050.1